VKIPEKESAPAGVAGVTAKRQDCRVNFPDRIVRDPAICAGQPVTPAGSPIPPNAQDATSVSSSRPNMRASRARDYLISNNGASAIL